VSAGCTDEEPLPTGVVPVACPHCNTEDVSFSRVQHLSQARRYLESPATTKLFYGPKSAENDARQGTAGTDGDQSSIFLTHIASDKLFLPESQQLSSPSSLDAKSTGGGATNQANWDTHPQTPGFDGNVVSDGVRMRLADQVIRPINMDLLLSPVAERGESRADDLHEEEEDEHGGNLNDTVSVLEEDMIE
jgi:hypothetical protein